MGAASRSHTVDHHDGQPAVARNFGSVLVSVVVALVLWEGFILLFHVDHVIARSPVDVWRYVFTQEADTVRGFRSTADNRHVLFDASRRHVARHGPRLHRRHRVPRWWSPTRSCWPRVEQAMMPLAMVLRTVPLVAMTPLIALIFGRDVLAVTVIAGIVSFFPTLVNIMYGLRATPSSSLDLMTSYGTSKLTTLRKVLFPSAMPSLFASLRITARRDHRRAARRVAGDREGLGAQMLNVVNTFDYGELWSAVVLVTFVSVVLYSSSARSRRRPGPLRARHGHPQA